ncbi:general secretion pathway protein GspB [Steroidobacter sp.]|uniref:general secretion pathway protein GspB n=1 Tax=Steroidobacter sp. TaxID=1978227 RepID=UPI001A3B0010|nr:general secretion pathway protein GspB [Steroidobacter sp.]MBL8267547.1 general secretion pathway protein GspB [Steroidobacter sp.]
MSFILDALKKSENERQRQVGPSLADMRAVRRHADRPWWVVAVAALLVINLGVLVVVLIRNGDTKPTQPAQSQPQTQSAPQPSYSPPPPAQPAPQQNYNAPPPAPAQQYQYQYQQPQQQQQNYRSDMVPTDPSVRSLADEARGYEEPYEQMNPNLAGAAAVPAGPPMVRQIQPPSVSPLPSGAVFEARTAANQPNSSRGAPAGNETLPTLEDLSASGTNLPDLHLDIHVHSQKPAERFVFVNMRKYLEGETLREGPSVERITAEGVILNQRGLRFLLPRQ